MIAILVYFAGQEDFFISNNNMNEKIEVIK